MESGSKRKHLFISHHHEDDKEVTNLTRLLSGKGFDIRNSSVRMNADNRLKMEEKRVSDKVIERILQMKISWAGIVVVLIGKQTHEREWVNWEIEKANEAGKRIVGIYIRGGTEADIPPAFEDYGSALVNWNSDSIINAIEGDNNFKKPDGSERPKSGSAESVNC